MEWRGMGWDEVVWNGMGWDEVVWHGMDGWNGMGGTRME